MNNTIQAIEKKVAIFTAEFRWVRASVMILVAVIILLFAQIDSLDNKIEANAVAIIGLDLRMASLESEVADLKIDVADLKTGQQQIFAAIGDLQQHLQNRNSAQ